MPRRKGPKPKPLKPGAFVAGLVRKSVVEYPPDCLTADQRGAHDEREIDVRKALVRDLAAREGRTVERWYVDWDVSGRAAYAERRTGLTQATSDIGDCLVSHLYVESLSRIYRDVERGLAFLEHARMHSCAIIAPDLGDFQDTAAGRMLLKIKLAVDQHESEIAGERIRDKNYQRVANGLWVGVSIPPLGLRYNKATKGLDIEPETAGDAVRLFELFVSLGGNINATSAELNRRLTESAPDAIRPRRGARWSATTVRRTIGLGAYRRRRGYMGDEWDGAALIPEVVPPDLVAQAVDLLRLRGEDYRQRYTRAHYGASRYVYAGLLRCGSCGGTRLQARFQTDAEGRVYLNWRCFNAEPGQRLCDMHAPADERIDALAGEALQKALREQIELARHVAPARKPAATGSAALEAQIAKQEQVRSNIIDLLAEGLITREDARPRKERAEAQIEELRARLRKAGEGPSESSAAITAQEAARLMARAQAYWSKTKGPKTREAYQDSRKRNLLLAAGFRATVTHERDGSVRWIKGRNYPAGTLTLTVEFDALGYSGERAIRVTEPAATPSVIRGF